MTYTEKHKVALVNEPGSFTHFPRSSNRTSIIDLTFVKGIILDQAKGWETDKGGGGDSDHVALITTLHIRPPPFFPTRQHQLTNWPWFIQTLSDDDDDSRNWENANTTVPAVERLTTLLQTAEDLNVPWSSPPAHSKRWWTPELTLL